MTKEERLIRDMKVGESGWTMPWAVRLGLQNDYWIDLDYNIYDDKQGTSTLEVTRYEDGYHPKLHEPYEYEPERISAWDRYFTRRYVLLPSFEQPI